MSTKHSIKNEVVQIIFFVFQIVIGSMALSHFALDLWTFFWDRFWDGRKMVSFSLSLTLARYVSHYCLHRSSEAQGMQWVGNCEFSFCGFQSRFGAEL